MKHFDAWVKPENPKNISEEQIQKLEKLPKAQLINNRLESFLGSNVESLNRENLDIKSMISPVVLRQFIEDTAQENNTSKWQIVKELRQIGVDEPQEKKEIEKKYQESAVYVGCVHGGDEKFFKKISEIAEDPPETMIFMGDVIGTSKFKELQKIFYNYVVNHSKNEILKEHPDANDKQILNYVGAKAPEDGLNLKQGYLRLFAYEQELAGTPTEEIKNNSEILSDQQIASEIRRLSKYAHFGHYASNLPEKIKAELVAGMKENLQKLIKPIKAMQKKGSKVVIMEGNWDARSPIDFESGIDEPVSLPKDKRLLNLAEYFNKENIPFFDKLTTLETKTSLHILAPFDAIINAPQMSDEEKQTIKDKVKKAREDKKAIILVGHGEPNWEIHNLPVDNSEPKGEHLQLIEGYKILISSFLPDEVIYDHMHDRIVDNQKQEVDANYKYAIQSSTNKIIDDINQFGREPEKQTLATYVPLRQTAKNIFDIKGSRKIEGLGGKRKPAKVIISNNDESDNYESEKFMSEINLNEAREYLMDVSSQAGEILKKYFSSGDYYSKRKEGVDFTTTADEKVDEFLIKQIKKKYPQSNFLTEETAPEDYLSLKNEKNLWVIDPLDGTINFSRQNSNFAISIALVDKGQVKLGVIHSPIKGETYSAQEDKEGAFMNNKKVNVSETESLRETTIACDWAWDLEKRKNVVGWIEKAIGSVRQIKSMGSAVADMASLSEGKIDAYFHSGLKPWDMAAASIIIKKAGGEITTPDGKKWDIFNSDILATNKTLHQKILKMINKP